MFEINTELAVVPATVANADLIVVCLLLLVFVEKKDMNVCIICNLILVCQV